MYNYTRRTSATESPLEYSDLSEYLRLSTDDDRQGVLNLCKSAAAFIERATGYALTSGTYQIDTEELGQRQLLFPAPLTAVTSVSYTDSDGVTTTLEASDYRVIKGAPGILVLLTTPEDAVSFTVVFTAGMTTVPDDLAQALRSITKYWYDNPDAAGGSLTELPLAVRAILDNHSIRLAY